MAVLLAALCAPAFAQSGGGYNIKKFTMASGGGTVTGGTYRLTGTVGQHDAGPISGGTYKLSGGFWSAAASPPPVAPTGDPSGLGKVRFISFSVTGGSGQSALRVNLVTLHHVAPPYTGQPTVSYTAFEGQAVWVGAPSTFMESSASGIPFKSAKTQCTPFYHDWNTEGLIHVRGSAIVPSSTYRVENVAAACQGVENTPACASGGASVSSQLEIRTNRWGDCDTPYNPPSPTTQPDLADVASMVNKFKGALGAPIKARVEIQSNDTFGNITDASLSVDFGFSHIAACVDGFRGQAYPAKMGRCSGAGTAACTTAADCSTGANVGPCNLNCQ